MHRKAVAPQVLVVPVEVEKVLLILQLVHLVRELEELLILEVAAALQQVYQLRILVVKVVPV